MSMNVLVIAPHPDDEVLGVGGTIAKRAIAGDSISLCIVTRGCEPLFFADKVEITRSECRKAAEYLGIKETFFLDFPAVMMEDIPRYQLNDALVQTVQKVKPDEVYIPHRGDMQLDHKMTVDAVMVALRPKYEHVVKRIYAYETLSETGWDIPNTINDFVPTVYEDISTTLKMKLDAMQIYQSQLAKFPNARSIEAIKALAMFRGSTVSLQAAEAFSLIREIKGI